VVNGFERAFRRFAVTTVLVTIVVSLAQLVLIQRFPAEEDRAEQRFVNIPQPAAVKGADGELPAAPAEQ
jgi:hypothetical protein